MSSQLASLLFKVDVQLWEDDARNARDYGGNCHGEFMALLVSGCACECKFSFGCYLLGLVDISTNYECD